MCITCQIIGMKKDIKYNLDECGSRRPFSVPEGYFDNLTQNIMSALPEQESAHTIKINVTPWMRLKPYIYAAAAFAGMYFIMKAGVGVTNSRNAEMAQTQETTIYSEEYIDSFLETSMIDDFTLYYTLVGAN